MKPACTCSTFDFNSSTLLAYEVFVVVVFVFFLNKISGISVECQAVWIQIMPIGPDLGPNCLQRLSADETSK